ncbi:ThiF family adenylyltransferase [Streptomyces sp. NBC_00287]|uniref:ThiF family adenylyltransferase n=1 Tax=Streptomyces sp. NBC_00287 TaxID=2975702 RepID=UPI002E2BB394|nr:ThiF family adenylyltransferase [Streptomyces sp. NBC_00287]
MRLLETVSSTLVDDGFVLIQGRQSLRVRAPRAWSEKTLAQLRQGWLLHDRWDAVGGRQFLQLVEELERMGWLRKSSTVVSVPPRLERQFGYLTLFGADPDAMTDRLMRASVALLGVGGVGAVVAQHLVAAGVGSLVLIDYDQVQIHNLNRQLAFTGEDIGRPKTEALASRLRALDPELQVRTIHRKVEVPDDLSDVSRVDMLVVCADTPGEVGTIAWKWCLASGTPWMRAAVGHEEGYWGPLLDPGLGHCLGCFDQWRLGQLSDLEQQLERELRQPTPWSFGPTNTVVSAWGAHDIVQYLCGDTPVSLNARVTVDFGTPAVRRSVQPPVRACEGHCSVGART